MRRSRKTDRDRAAGAREFLTCMAARLAAFALLRRSRKTDRDRAAGARGFLTCMAARLAAFALIRGWESFSKAAIMSDRLRPAVGYLPPSGF